MVFLVVLAVLIIIGLASYAAWLFRKIRIRDKDRELAVEKLVKQKKESETYARDSIIVLLRGLQQDQVSLTEVAIRITGLCQVLPAEEVEKFRLFAELANKTSHIPIKEDWKALSRAKKRVFDKERETLEAEYMPKVEPIINQVLNTTETSAPVVQMFNPANQTVH